MKIWFISDTHGNHNKLIVPRVDLVIHTGDATNWHDQFRNHHEFVNFFHWFIGLDIKHKVYVPGNHDAFINKNERQCKILFEGHNIHLLINEGVEIEGIKIWGSPITPTFGDWHYMCSRDKIIKYWNEIPENLDVLATHGPPKGILDLSISRQHKLEYCGDNALFNAVMKVKPKIHSFGHIHNSNGCLNQGVRIFNDINFINASCCTDGDMYNVSSNGIIKEL